MANAANLQTLDALVQSEKRQRAEKKLEDEKLALAREEQERVMELIMLSNVVVMMPTSTANTTSPNMSSTTKKIWYRDL